MAARCIIPSLLSFLPALTAAQQCPLQFDGRVPNNFSAATFDTQNGLFNPDNVFGQGLKLSQVVLLQNSAKSLFDSGTVPVEVTISDKSIFAPSATNVQTGFRRAELLIASNDGTDASTTGVKTLHFSVMKDETRPLNLTHEYQLVFLESSDFSTNQFVLKTGTILGGNTADPDTLQLFGNVNADPVQTLFKTPFTKGVFHNFAVALDFNALLVNKNPVTTSAAYLTEAGFRTTQVFYSRDNEALVPQTNATKNDISGQGQFHFGVLKKPVNGGSDITKSGEQESGINEGIIFGGIFEEDSTGGCISLSPKGSTAISRHRKSVRRHFRHT